MVFKDWLSGDRPWAASLLTVGKGPVNWYRIEMGTSRSVIVGSVDHLLWDNSIIQRQVLLDHVQPFIFEQRKMGSTAILVWEDQWRASPDIIQSRIKALMGLSHRIPARLTKARRVDKLTAKNFLSANHLQGSTSSKYQICLYLPETYFRVLPESEKMRYFGLKELPVALATFSHVRVFDKMGKPHRSYELIRFASLLEYTVVGGLDKLLKAFATTFQPDDIMTYADLDWSSGNSYLRLGFEPISEMGPLAFSINSETGERRVLHDASDIVSSGKIVWNSGSLKLVKTFMD